MTKEELKQEAEEKADIYVDDKYDEENDCFSLGYARFVEGFLASAEPREKQITGLSKHILELQKDKGNLIDRCRELEAQIEKMKCCSNCKYWFCTASSISIDENYDRTVHNWNKEKQAYCDVGKNGKYQCWELAE